MSKPYNAYVASLFDSFAAYRQAKFPNDDLFVKPREPRNHPQEFKKLAADQNVILPPSCSAEISAAIIGSIPAKKRHPKFGSMRSSQALAQSVFGGLSALGRLDVLASILAEDGRPAFFSGDGPHQIELEHDIATLGEPRSTSIDVLFTGATRVAVEVKLTEQEFGTCSRPRLRATESNFVRDHCDGSFTFQRGRHSRCSLSSQGIRYWDYIPQLLNWSSIEDMAPCLLGQNYQLIRNILSATVCDNGACDPHSAHALVIYDERNPEFQSGGLADLQWKSVVADLRYPHLLRRVSWQTISNRVNAANELKWLAFDLHFKYGL
jgi:hypothetical protein